MGRNGSALTLSPSKWKTLCCAKRPACVQRSIRLPPHEWAYPVEGPRPTAGCSRVLSTAASTDAHEGNESSDSTCARGKLCFVWSARRRAGARLDMSPAAGVKPLVRVPDLPGGGTARLHSRMSTPGDGGLQSAVCAPVHWSCSQSPPCPSANEAVVFLATTSLCLAGWGEVRGGLLGRGGSPAPLDEEHGIRGL